MLKKATLLKMAIRFLFNQVPHVWVVQRESCQCCLPYSGIVELGQVGELVERDRSRLRHQDLFYSHLQRSTQALSDMS